MPLAAGTRLGPYEVLGPIGAGGMGEVYRARDTRLDRRVAVKVLPARLSDDCDALARFQREAKAVAALSHPSILAIFDIGTSDGISYAVTELLEGETLGARLADGPLSVRKAVEYAIQIAHGLGAAHEKGIVHRDLKPENLFLTKDGRVKILDFGLARQAPLLQAGEMNSPTLTVCTEPGTVLGTVAYMSPEQVRGLPPDARSDIFAFGVVLYEMLSGRRPFSRDSAAETMHAILAADPPELLETNRNVPAAVERIVRHCLEKRPEQRFHSAFDLAFDLEALSASSGTTAAPITRGAMRDKRVVGVIALLAAAAVGFLIGRTLGTTVQLTEPPTYRRLTYERGYMQNARFAPDGTTVVYSAGWRGEPTNVFTTRLDSQESRSLGLGEASLLGVSSKSELAIGFEANGRMTLSRVPLAGGAPREVIDRVGSADWSPDGSDLAVVRRVGDSSRVEFPIGTILYTSNGSITNVRVSPGGDWVAFIDQDAGALMVVDRHGVKRMLSKGWGDAFGVAWHPDGREVWFTAGKIGPAEFKSLRAVTIDGHERLISRMLGQIDLEDIGRDGRVLVQRVNISFDLDALPPGATTERDLTWFGFSALSDLSSDGKWVLFTEGADPGVTYLRKTDGTPAVRLGDGHALALSRDGKWALCLLTSPRRLVVIPTGVGDRRTLPGPELHRVEEATWFPDSRRVLFTAEATAGEGVRAYVQDIGGGQRTPVGPVGIGSPVIVSPDGETIAAASPKGPVLFSVNGNEARPVHGTEPHDSPVQWSAEGRSLYVSRVQGQVSQIFRVELLTGRRTLVHEVSARDWAGASWPFQLRITPDGKSYAYTFQRLLDDLFLVEGLK